MACSTRARRRRCQRHLRSRTIRFPRNRGVTKLGYAAIATVGQHTFVVLAQLFYGRASVVNRIISVAGSTGDGLDDVEVSPTDENLGVARPSIVLRFGSVAVVAGWHERSIDDPRFATIPWCTRGASRQLSRTASDHPMCCRLRDPEDRGELAYRQVRAQGDARDHDALSERARPRAASSWPFGDAVEDGGELAIVECREHEHARSDKPVFHCQIVGVGSLGDVVRNADTRSQQAHAVGATLRGWGKRAQARARHSGSGTASPRRGDVQCCVHRTSRAPA